MAAQTTQEEASPEARNEVQLVGRVSADPEERTLPSGDVLWTFRVVVARPRPARHASSARNAPKSPTSDTVDCSVWSGRVRRSVATWRAGDVVEVRGALRRRFWRTAGGAASRTEVEVAGGRVIRRAAT